MKNKKVFKILLFLLIVGLVYLAFLQFKISQYSGGNAPSNADYVIILGAKVNGTKPSLALAYRIDAALDYLKKNKNTIVIASGGKGPNEGISEAEAIKNALVKKGINKSRIILESDSTSTYENMKFSKQLLPKDANKGIIVTNHFHVYRSILVAKDQDLHVSYISAQTPTISIPKSYIREYMAITKYYIDRVILY